MQPCSLTLFAAVGCYNQCNMLNYLSPDTVCTKRLRGVMIPKTFFSGSFATVYLFFEFRYISHWSDVMIYIACRNMASILNIWILAYTPSNLSKHTKEGVHNIEKKLLQHKKMPFSTTKTGRRLFPDGGGLTTIYCVLYIIYTGSYTHYKARGQCTYRLTLYMVIASRGVY